MPKARSFVVLAIAALALLATVLPSAGARTAAPAAKTWTVKLSDFKFTPSSINAKAGDKVTFVWVQGVHNVVSKSGPAKVNSGPPTQKGNLTITLKKGTYNLICVPHAALGMKMTIKAS